MANSSGFFGGLGVSSAGSFCLPVSLASVVAGFPSDSVLVIESGEVAVSAGAVASAFVTDSLDTVSAALF